MIVSSRNLSLYRNNILDIWLDWYVQYDYCLLFDYYWHLLLIQLFPTHHIHILLLSFHFYHNYNINHCQFVFHTLINHHNNHRLLFDYWWALFFLICHYYMNNSFTSIGSPSIARYVNWHTVIQIISIYNIIFLKYEMCFICIWYLPFIYVIISFANVDKTPFLSIPVEYMYLMTLFV